MDNKPFDHDAHCRLLDDAARELRSVGKDALAGAVEKARCIHIDFQSRVATARREVKRMRDAADRLNDIAGTIEQYVSVPRAPWIGCDLFPKESE